jgi:hypothetical protein
MEIKDIKDQIELMDKQHQMEVLRILSGDKHIILNENSNGVFVNLTDLNETTIKKLINYISYVTTQTNNIKIVETQKETIENTFFCKGNKDSVRV